MDNASAKAGEIAGIGLSGQYHGAVLLDKAYHVLRPCILWCDQRTSQQAEYISKKIGKEELLRITANPASYYFTACKILWVKAGHSHTFAPLLRAQLNEALGIAQEADPNNVGQVRVVVNSTVGARVKRHLQMAEILRRKGRIESAVVQLHKAGELDPNSIDVALALAGLHLKTGHGGKALKVIARLVAGKLSDKMKLLLTSGQAKRQAGELDAAEKLLLEATGLDPNSSKALFELGKVYQKREQTDKAMTVYRRALSLVFGDERAPADSTN